MASFMATSVANSLSGPMVLIFIKGPLQNLKVNHMAVLFVLSPSELEFLVIFCKGPMLCCLFGGGEARAPTGTEFFAKFVVYAALVYAKPSILARVFRV